VTTETTTTETTISETIKESETKTKESANLAVGEINTRSSFNGISTTLVGEGIEASPFQLSKFEDLQELGRLTEELTSDLTKKEQIEVVPTVYARLVNDIIFNSTEKENQTKNLYNNVVIDGSKETNKPFDFTSINVNNPSNLNYYTIAFSNDFSGYTYYGGCLLLFRSMSMLLLKI